MSSIVPGDTPEEIHEQNMRRELIEAARQSALKAGNPDSNALEHGKPPNENRSVSVINIVLGVVIGVIIFAVIVGVILTTGLE